jgi:hypothetical protein
VRVRALAATALVSLAVSGCAGPSHTYDDYQSKAANTVAAVMSAVQTAQLAVQAQRTGKATRPYLSVIIGESEETVGGVQAQFDSVQPPDARSDKLRSTVDDLLAQADDVISALRIAVRRGRLDRLSAIAGRLVKLVAVMRKFQAANG